MFDNYPDLLTFAEVCEMLRVKNTKLYEMLRGNRIKHYKDQGKYLIPKSAVIAYLESIVDDGK